MWLSIENESKKRASEQLIIRSPHNLTPYIKMYVQSQKLQRGISSGIIHKVQTPIQQALRAKKHSARVPTSSYSDSPGVEVIDFDTYLRRKELESGLEDRAANIERV